MMRRLPVIAAFALFLAPALAQDGSGDANIGKNILDELRDRLQACWNLPPHAVDAGPVTLKVTLGKDGSLLGEPQITRRGKGEKADLLAKSAVRAVKKCAHGGKLALSPETYDDWREMILTFDPRDMLN